MVVFHFLECSFSSPLSLHSIAVTRSHRHPQMRSPPATLPVLKAFPSANARIQLPSAFGSVIPIRSFATLKSQVY